MEYRIEKDSMGEVKVPANARYGASTQRAVDNFPISGIRFSRKFIWALGLQKGSSASVAAQMGFIDESKSAAIRQAADEVMDGDLDDDFVLDIFQTGSGTSTNTNANEVIASRASEILGSPVHPNDDVNFGQSSNDVIPTAMHVAAVAAINDDLLPALDTLAGSLRAKSDEFGDVVKSGRTHLMDATPVTLGQEFGGYAVQVSNGKDRVEMVLPQLLELGSRWYRGRDRHQCPRWVRLSGNRSHGVTNRYRIRRGAGPLRGTRWEGRLRDGVRCAPDDCGLVLQDRQRHPVSGLRADVGYLGDTDPGSTARLIHHARQGQPGDVRDVDDGVGPCHR